eukprot:2497720-Rhodomonas_salina.1
MSYIMTRGDLGGHSARVPGTSSWRRLRLTRTSLPPTSTRYSCLSCKAPSEVSTEQSHRKT